MTRPLRDCSPHARLRVGVAAIGALLAHVLFLHAFRVAGTAVAPHRVDEELGCVLLSPPAQAQAWEQELRAWCELADPTLLSLPNEFRGFSSVRRRQLILPYAGPPLYEYVGSPAPEREWDDFKLSARLPSVVDEIIANWQLPAPQMPAEPPVGRLPAGVVWRLPDGVVLQDMPTPPLDRVRSELAREFPSAATRVEVRRDQRRTRVRVRESCGNSELDLLLTGTISRSLSRMERVGTESTEHGAGLLVPELNQCRVFEVEWRLASGAVED